MEKKVLMNENNTILLSCLNKNIEDRIRSVVEEDFYGNVISTNPAAVF